MELDNLANVGQYLENRAFVGRDEMNRRYNPEFDIALDDPVVTWADKKLLEMVEYLMHAVVKLQEDIAWLSHDMDELVANGQKGEDQK